MPQMKFEYVTFVVANVSGYKKSFITVINHFDIRERANWVPLLSKIQYH